MKKSYTTKRTTIALDPELTKRIEKMLKNKGMKLSKYTQEVLRSALAVDEMNQTVEFYKKLRESGQYQKIKRLEGEVEKLKEYHITEKKLDKKLEKLKSQRIGALEKKVARYEKVMAYIRQNRIDDAKKTEKKKENKRWLRPVGEPFSGR